MPTLDLTTEELRDAAMASRAAAQRAKLDAGINENPRIKAAFAASAERYGALSEKLERARRGGDAPYS